MCVMCAYCFIFLSIHQATKQKCFDIREYYEHKSHPHTHTHAERRNKGEKERASERASESQQTRIQWRNTRTYTENCQTAIVHSHTNAHTHTAGLQCIFHRTVQSTFTVHSWLVRAHLHVMCVCVTHCVICICRCACPSNHEYQTENSEMFYSCWVGIVS